MTLRGAHEWRYPFQQIPYAKHSLQRNGEIIYRLVAQGKVRTSPLISRVLDPTQALFAYEALQQHAESCLSVVFDSTKVGEYKQ